MNNTIPVNVTPNAITYIQLLQLRTTAVTVLVRLSSPVACPSGESLPKLASVVGLCLRLSEGR